MDDPSGSPAAPARRGFLIGAAACAGQAAAGIVPARAARPRVASLLQSAPIEIAGDWTGMLPDSALRVVGLMRHACLDGLGLSSDGQPSRLRVERRPSGLPAIWLHRQPSDLAWILVNVGPRDWSKLAYQFGHELGHVVANSWRDGALPAPPCRWLEEALVEAFSLRGLSRLADDWSRHPPFAGDSGFGAALAVYRQAMIEAYGKLAAEQGHPDDLGAWFRALRPRIEAEAGLGDYAKAASLTLLAEFENDPAGLEGLCALNRWPELSAVPLPTYLRNWEASCRALGVSPALPVRLRELG